MPKFQFDDFQKALKGLPDDIKLDFTQFVIDLVGIGDPTGAADILNAGISAWRGDWFGMATSLVSVLPGADVVKFLKLNRYGQTVIRLSRFLIDNPQLLKKMQQFLEVLQPMVKALPVDLIAKSSDEAAMTVRMVQGKIDDLIRRAKAVRIADMAPKFHDLADDLRKMSPDRVRELVKARGYTVPPGWQRKPVPIAGADGKKVFVGQSEIFVKHDGKNGYFVVRLDPMGHATKRRTADGRLVFETPGPHGGRPHTHKEWIPEQNLQKYLEGPTANTMKYEATGGPALSVGDQLWKDTHHPR
jgi:hypothetical protein